MGMVSGGGGGKREREIRRGENTQAIALFPPLKEQFEVDPYGQVFRFGCLALLSTRVLKALRVL